MTVAPVRLAAAGSQRRTPPLPIKVSASTRAWWKTLWASPMAAAWLDADMPGLVRLASLVERVSEGKPPLGLLAEIRNLEDRYGLSPLARRRLQWEVERAGGPVSSTPREDESRWLRAVSD